MKRKAKGFIIKKKRKKKKEVIVLIYIILDMEGFMSNDVRASFFKERKQCFYQSQVASNIATEDAGYEEDEMRVGFTASITSSDCKH